MLTQNDLILLLTEMEEKGLNTSKYLNMVFKENSINLTVLKYINDNRQLEVAQFYELIRKNYNSKKSPLYKNIVKEYVKTPTEILTTLSALNLQIFLFASKLEKPEMFLKHARGEEITWVLNNYYKTYDLIPCNNLLQLIKADLKAFENIR